VNPIAIVARGAISPQGAGERATSVGVVGERPRNAAREDPAWRQAGLRKPRSARAFAEPVPLDDDRARALLARAARDLVERLDNVVPAWRGLRVALCIGTSAGGLGSLERALALRADEQPIPAALARSALYAGPLAELDAWFATSTPRVSLLGACVASTFALGLAARWLDAGHADLVVAGGYDALTTFLASGFEALGATSGRDPAPFRSTRDGMVLGEGAALVALMRAEQAPSADGYVLGFGAASDAVHVTAPDPQGLGLARAALAALADARVTADMVDFVSAHATATPHNDAAEAAALKLVFGADASRLVVHPFKAVIGHTLGAAGALETLAAVDAMRARILPAAAGIGPIAPAFAGRLLETNGSGRTRLCLKLSAAFGGANAALVLGAEPSERPLVRAAPRVVRVLHETSRITAPDLALLAARTRLDELRRSRLDRASALAVTAAARAFEAVPDLDPETTAVVLGTFAASLEADEAFDARRRERGAMSVEPRRFPPTSPNLPAGWCAIAFGLRGPSVAVGGGPGALEQALSVGHALVWAGDAEHALVISCDDVGPVTNDLCRAAGASCPTDGAFALVLGLDPRGYPVEPPTFVVR
jgi:3-oxoacyl-[acyl-carrier-protein] synthase II